ncbi:MAG: hypothetical protein COY66_02360 [Candidatus Kerfeldbacteria bacterium CG_4_10_14_0_8_um_filter_42_10]|uniref:Uncharacterized protein n=1 Tax=Candidatus Kerfeldbacteria bacterium CG_4_10_14_0_8_um_filter_42_10 TaxID=2014248 RepID=A0A2M7RJC2_9BACT|nr:MAG: hypothetical protein COY66_02360 [Candidatus Kerfeldbacteria bacterium CG_4_10_14_0_8_um_filter_42_10]
MKKNTLTFIFLGLGLLSIFLLSANPVYSDCEPGSLLPPCTCSGNCKLNDFLALAAQLAQYGLGLLSIITLFFVIQSGFSLMTAMGNSEKIESGKKMLGGTFRGMAIVLLAWVLVNTIVFLFTGNASGLLFGGTGNPWWKFEETPILQIDERCPRFRQPYPEHPECHYLQSCQDTSGQTEQWKTTAHCWSYGVCAGPDAVICCDSGQTEGSCSGGAGGFY